MVRAPLISSRPGASASRASGPALAWRRIAARSARAAACAARPETRVWREAEVLPASGVRWVSPETKRKAASGRPRASAAIWAITVAEPWPMSMAPWCSATRPSRSRPMRMVEGFGSEVLPQPYQQAARPTPRRGPRPAALASAASRAGCPPARAQRLEALGDADARSRWPVAVASPSRSAFRRRKSSGSMPAASASRSTSVSVAIAAWGTPKPRKAPATGPWVWTARARAWTSARGRGRWRAPGRGSPRSGRSSRRRRCRRRRRSRGRSGGRRRRSRGGR